MPDFDTLQRTHLAHLDEDMATLITCARLPQILQEACLYAVGAGGKRIRPLLVLSAFLACGGRMDDDRYTFVRRASAALELLHGYSLVHDDLPCMDDDELRRGRPTCHIVYGEDVALLVGDVLQSLAMEVLIDDELLDDDGIAMALLQAFVPRARRMVSGQMLDILAENQSITQAELEKIHRDKTGALIEAALMMGGICAKASAKQMDDLHQLGMDLGLVFQVQDDILDVTADTLALGKPAGSDDKLNKSTYVKLLGVDGAHQYANQLFTKILVSASRLDTNTLNALSTLIKRIQARQK